MNADRRCLIVNADDFGQSPGVTRGIIEAFEQGIATSASLMVRWPSAGEAAAYGRANPTLSVGLHLDLGEWIYRKGEWLPAYEVVPNDDGRAVAAEIERQVERFRSLMGREPSHLDSHQHVHCSEPVRSAALALARRLRVPLRHCSPAIRYCGEFYGQTEEGTSDPGAVSPEALIRIIGSLLPGFTELACHPGHPPYPPGMYCDERFLEVTSLCDQRVRAALAAHEVALSSFNDQRCDA